MLVYIVARVSDTSVARVVPVSDINECLVLGRIICIELLLMNKAQ